MRRLLPALAAALVLTGCGGGQTTDVIVAADVEHVARILPTPRGLDQASSVLRRADAALVQRTFAGGTADAAAAQRYRDIGLKEAAVRTWTGPGGAEFAVVVSRWPDHQTATNTGGGAAEILPMRAGAQGWTPRELPGARGSRAPDADPPTLALAFSVGDVSVYVGARGPVGEAAVVRTLDLAIRALDATP